MVDPIYAGIRLINGLVTIFLAYPIYKIYGRTRKNFYLYWSLGYVLYGLNIVMRIPLIASNRDVSVLGLASYSVFALGLGLIIAGIGDLVNRSRQLLLSTLILPVILYGLILTGEEWIDFGLLAAISPYIFITGALLYIRIKYRLDITLLLAGWANMLFLNIGYLYEIMNEGFVDLMTTFTKVVIYFGMTSPSFSFLYEELTNFLMGGIPVEYHETTAGFTMIDLNVKNREKEITWIKERIKQNSRQAKRTILVSLYDQITAKDIIDEDTQDNLYLVRMANGYRRSFVTFEEQVTSINDDIQLLDILFSDIISFSNSKYIPCEIIVYTLSQLIITHGSKRIYGFLTTKMSQIKSSQVNFIGFYNLGSHENPAEIRIFESLADLIINQDHPKAV